MINKEDYIPISEKQWPKYDESFMVSDSITIAVQINGKTRGTIDIDKTLEQEMIFKRIRSDNKFGKYLTNKKVIKKIYVPNRLVNFVIA